MKNTGKTRIYRVIIFCVFMLSVFSGVFAAENNNSMPAADPAGTGNVQTLAAEPGGTGEDIRAADDTGTAAAVQTITVDYSGSEDDIQTITVDYCDDWLLEPDDEYNHKLMQASFALAAAGFRDKTKDITQRDFNILDFFAQAGFIEPRTIDFDVTPSIDTIGTAIAHKPVGDVILIAVSISGNNYQGEWAGNMTIDDENRVKGFNDAADKVFKRLNTYIRDHDLHGDLHLWTSGYSRAAAVTNDFAADATDSGLFHAVHAYTFATPRTTKEIDADHYHNIFNLINPFDIVPMSPFPEWGFVRYGIDLFYPAIETNSNWFTLQDDAAEFITSVTNEKIVLNPQVNKNLHTIFDYLAFFISSANSYKTIVQSPLVEFIETRDLKSLIRDITELVSFDSIRKYLLRRDEIARYQMHEFYGFLDFVTQFTYTSLIGYFNKNATYVYWDPTLSAKENLAFNHYDKIYRGWLFSNDDPEVLLSREANYAHVVIQGDVEVDVFDENYDYLVHINNQFASYSVSPEDIRMPSYSGEESDMYIYYERQTGQTLIILPLDKVYHVGIYSLKNQTIRVSYVEYSAEKLQADVCYVYLDQYDEGEYYLETFDPEVERTYTTEDLLDMGVLVVEPWSRDIVYSPTAIMRLENEGVPHPSPKILIFFIVLVLLLFIFLIVWIVIIFFKIIKKILKKLKRVSSSGV